MTSVLALLHLVSASMLHVAWSASKYAEPHVSSL